MYGRSMPAIECPDSCALVGISSCISSMKRITSPACANSFMAFAMSSSMFCPGLDACAMRAFISSLIILLSLICSGTSPLFILCATPSMRLDFPVPGSPIRSACLLFTLPSIDTSASISRSCPIPKTSLVLAICSVIFVLKWLSMNVYPYIHCSAIPPFL